MAIGNRHDPTAGTVLFVYPSGVERDLYAASLSDSGFAIITAASLTEACSLLEGGSMPDIMVMDLQPEPHAAWDFIASRTGQTSSVPIIILTSLIRPDGLNRRKARALGCAAFVAKPCALPQLVEVVSRVRAGSRGLEIATYSG